MSLKLLSFDVWDTLIIDDSDEIYRSENGLPTKKQERIKLYLQTYSAIGSFSNDEILNAINLMHEEFNELWKIKHQTPTVRWRLNHIEKTLGKNQGKPLILAENIKTKLIRELEDMELKYPILAMPGIKSFLENWKKYYPEIPLAIVSDAIYSPGRSIRMILEKLELLEYFSYFAFSDEVGASKPSQKVFNFIRKQAGVSPEEIIHVGDRYVNDIDGPKNFGAMGILCQVNKSDSAPENGTLYFKNYSELIEVIKEYL